MLETGSAAGLEVERYNCLRVTRRRNKNYRAEVVGLILFLFSASCSASFPAVAGGCFRLKLLGLGREGGVDGQGGTMEVDVNPAAVASVPYSRLLRLLRVRVTLPATNKPSKGGHKAQR